MEFGGGGGSRDDAGGAPGRDGDDGVGVRFPHGGRPLGGQGPDDDPAVGVAGQEARVGAEEVHGVDLGVVAAEDVDWLGGWEGGGGWWGHEGGGEAGREPGIVCSCRWLGQLPWGFDMKESRV